MNSPLLPWSPRSSDRYLLSLPAIHVCGLSTALSLCLNLLVHPVETLCLGAVTVVPEVTGEVSLVEDCAVRAEEGVESSWLTADMKHLALSSRVSIVTTRDTPCAGEGGGRYGGEDWVVLTRNPRNYIHQHFQIVMITNN